VKYQNLPSVAAKRSSRSWSPARSNQARAARRLSCSASDRVQPLSRGSVVRQPRMFQIAMRTAKTLRASGLRCEGVNLFLADGEAAFQKVFHVHLHVIPRFEGDGFRLDVDSKAQSRAEFDAIAAQLRATYEALRIDTS
jgi:HIT domain